MLVRKLAESSPGDAALTPKVNQKQVNDELNYLHQRQVLLPLEIR